MKQADVVLLYDYNYWADARILTAASRISASQFTASTAFPCGSLRGTLVHILDGERAWRELLQHDRMRFDELKEAKFPSVTSMQDRWHEDEAAMRAYLAGLDDEKLLGVVRYTTDEGNKRERILWHCLYHLVNHGTQHRSEAAAMLTDYGQSPGDIDFTLFLNERK